VPGDLLREAHHLVVGATARPGADHEANGHARDENCLVSHLVPFFQCVASMAHGHPRSPTPHAFRLTSAMTRWLFQAICPSLPETTHPGPGYPPKAGGARDSEVLRAPSNVRYAYPQHSNSLNIDPA
jgi:hypothetical protein